LRTPHRLAMGLTVWLAASAAHAAAVDGVFGGRIPCEVRSGVQFCAGSVATRIESFDGVPLDVNLTLPPPGVAAPYPLIVELHGWSEGKAEGPFTGFANEGYAVLSYTARGFHGSCGSAASRAPDPSLSDPDVCEKRGWIRLADARYEAHDTQHLVGLLVDEGLVRPDAIGVTGGSYGGGQSLILAALNDRVMRVDGRLVPWTSPAGTPLRIAAAAPLVPWSDLAYSLQPNGRTLDYRTVNDYGPRAGVQKQSWNAVLYGAGLASGFYAPPGVDPSSDITSWNARIVAGEPYDGDFEVARILAEIEAHHSAYSIDDSVPPAPLFIYNAWTDDLFPVDEALRYWRKVESKHPNAEIALHFADAFGHPRASLAGDTARVAARVEAFFAAHLRGDDVALPPALETYTQVCDGGPAGGPFVAASWDAIHPGEVRYSSRSAQSFDSKGGDAATAAALDPLSGGPCRTVDADDDPGAATYRLPAATGAGYTLMGSPTIIADFAVRGDFAEIAARLWDVSPDGSQTLVSHAFYRPRTDDAPRQVFQLHPNGWAFRSGHVAKLELLGRSAPYGRPSNGEFTVRASNLELRLPVLEEPDGGAVRAPARHVLPPSGPEPITGSASCRVAAGARVPLGCRPLPSLRAAAILP